MSKMCGNCKYKREKSVSGIWTPWDCVLSGNRINPQMKGCALWEKSYYAADEEREEVRDVPVSGQAG